MAVGLGTPSQRRAESYTDKSSLDAVNDGDNNRVGENKANGNQDREGHNGNDGAEARREPSLYATDLQSACLTVVDPKGKLVLVVGRPESPRRLIVSSNVKRLSPQWKAVVAGSTRESMGRKKQIRLPDDDADMMLVLMWIVHTRFSEVPGNLKFPQLLALARICNRYNMNEMTNPYIVAWLAPHQSRLLTAGFEEWLYIAYQFGMEANYAKLSKHLAIECRVNADKQLLVPGSDRLLAGSFPEECLAAIRHTRVKTLVRFLDTMYTLVTKMVESNSCRAPHPPQTVPDTDERTMCTLYNHGFMIRYLKMLGLWPPIANVSSIEDSVSEVAHKLFATPSIALPLLRHDSVTTQVRRNQGTSPRSQHAACDVGKVLAGKIQEVLDRMEHPMEERTLVAIRNNARALGKFPVESRKAKKLLVIGAHDLEVNTAPICL